MAIFYFLIFPGFLFTAITGLLSTWIDRKLTAKIQWRVGPPWYQPFADILKLLSKETILPEGSRRTGFLVAPLIGLAGAILVSTMLWRLNLAPEVTFIGDLIVVLYLLILPSLAVIIGGSASANPLGATGANREMKLVLAYELPFLIAVFTAVVSAGGSIKMGEILKFQAANGLLLGSWSGAMAFIVSLLCIQAKLTFIPFDIPEAETEIMAGPYIEYSGPALAIFKLTRAMMLFVLPVFLITIFWGGLSFSGMNALWTILKYLALLVIIILIKNTNPRLRIDQALKFFWFPVTGLAILGIILALFGR